VNYHAKSQFHENKLSRAVGMMLTNAKRRGSNACCLGLFLLLLSPLLWLTCGFVRESDCHDRFNDIIEAGIEHA